MVLQRSVNFQINSYMSFVCSSFPFLHLHTLLAQQDFLGKESGFELATSTAESSFVGMRILRPSFLAGDPEPGLNLDRVYSSPVH